MCILLSLRVRAMIPSYPVASVSSPICAIIFRRNKAVICLFHGALSILSYDGGGSEGPAALVVAWATTRARLLTPCPHGREEERHSDITN